MTSDVSVFMTSTLMRQRAYTINFLLVPWLLLLIASLGPVELAHSEPSAFPDVPALSQACYSKVGPLLQDAGGRLAPEVRKAYLDWVEQVVLEQLRLRNQSIPEECLAEVQQPGVLRDAMFGSVFPPDPSLLQNYAKLRTQLGESFLRKYRSLVIAVAVAKRIKGVEAGDSIAIGRDYQPGFWEELLPGPGSEPEKDFVRRIAAFMKDSGVSAADLYTNETRQAQLRAALNKQQVAPAFIAEIKKSYSFADYRLRNAMILLGQRPAARDPKPDTIAWLRHLAAIYQARPDSTPTVNGRAMTWPLFPIDTAPWPLLMPLAHPVPLREADYIWEAFQGKHGDDRYHVYGPFQGHDGVLVETLKPSKWYWDAWPDVIVHGGMCIPLSKATVELYSALGKPAMWAGQPGHANLISFQYVDGLWKAENEQAFAGGIDVTHGQWYFDEDPEVELRFRDHFPWAGAEYHVGLGLAMNVSLRSYLDTRLATHLFTILPVAEKQTLGVKLLRSTLLENPYNPALWYRLAQNATDFKQGVTLIEAVMAGNPGRLSDPAMAYTGKKMIAPQYWQTLVQFVARYSLLAHSPPQQEADRRRVFRLLKSVPGLGVEEMVAYYEKFNSAEPKAEAVQYDRKLAEAGDAFGQLRMGQRYRDGDGVPPDDVSARRYLTRSAMQGEGGAAVLLARLYPSVPADLITVNASSVFNPNQLARHLVDGSGMTGAAHDNDVAARTMWLTVERPASQPPVQGLGPSPAWVRFDFTQPQRFDTILIWNYNQVNQTDRGFRRTRIWGLAEGGAWIPLTLTAVIELPRASGLPFALPVLVSNKISGRPFKSVIIAADAAGGNYGGNCYGLSAVRFVVGPKS